MKVKITDHPFTPETTRGREQWCGHMSPSVTIGSTNVGTVSMSVGCGYPESEHLVVAEQEERKSSE